MALPTNKPPSKRGRPVDPQRQAQRREDLLDAAFELLRHQNYRSITIRDLAAEAGTQSAMIKYDFGNKRGLFVALLERISAKQFANVQALLSAPDPIRAFIDTTLSFFENNPQIINLMTTEVLSGDSELQQDLIDMMPKKMAALLPRLIENQQQAGKLRADLDPKWVAFSLVSLILTPFIGAPIRQHAWQISNEQIHSPAWADHIYRLFIEGVRA
ncbi:MAG: TetR/AcrR family transcriptional regulator [Motiliproteus sp.]